MTKGKSSALLPQILLITAVVAAGWAGLLFLPEHTDEAQTSIQPKQVADVIEDRDGYDFYGILSTDEVEVAISNYTSTPKTAALEKLTLLQIAAFKDFDQAAKVRDRLIIAGLENTRVVSRKSSQGTWHLVRTTPYERYDQLKKALSLAEKLNHHPRPIEVK